jgi:TPR repeat protein
MGKSQMKNRIRISRTKRLLLQMIVGGAYCLSHSTLKADDFKDGMAAFNKGQHEVAFKHLRISAEKGHVSSQYIVSTMYRQGLGVKADKFEGFTWCKQAAEQGHPEAQFQLGLMYLEGEGVTNSDVKAQEWLWSAADRGYSQATEVLTYIYSDDGVEDFGIGC